MPFTSSQSVTGNINVGQGPQLGNQTTRITPRQYYHVAHQPRVLDSSGKSIASTSDLQQQLNNLEENRIQSQRTIQVFNYKILKK